MTDNTQELDEILALLDARMPQPKTMNEYTARAAMLREAKQATLDWHNKQIEAVLDRLESSIDDGKKSHSMAVISDAIEAERAKLKDTPS